jgi:pilus assembly protein CpaD
MIHVPRKISGARIAARHLAALVAAALPLAACSGVDRVVTASVVADDYHVRHPIVLANAAETLDVFLVGRSGRLDRRQRQDVKSYAETYRVKGQGVITALLPRGAALGGSPERTLDEIRHELSANGVHGSLSVGEYPVRSPGLAAPVRLSFNDLQAKSAHRCGEWPDDLASGSTIHGWENHTYYNLGCATQQDIAAQIDDPRDLVRPRAEDPPDVQMRTRAITNISQGVDPATQWLTHDSSILAVP